MTVIHDKIVHNCLIVPERERRSRSRPQCEIFFPCVAKHSAKIANSAPVVNVIIRLVHSANALLE